MKYHTGVYPLPSIRYRIISFAYHVPATRLNPGEANAKGRGGVTRQRRVIVMACHKTTKWEVTAVIAAVELRRTRERMARALVIAQQ